MAKAKKDNLPKAVNIPADSEPGSSITYANEVVATIAGVAANEVEGIAGMCNVPNGSRLGSGSRSKGITRGVKVEVGPEEVSCDIYLNIEYGRPIQKVAGEVQENVRRAVESMTGLHVVNVDVHVQGVSFEKENSALTAGAKKAKLEAYDDGTITAKPAQHLAGGQREEAPAAEAPAAEPADAPEENA